MFSNLKGMFSSGRETISGDVLSGLMVFLIALPLSVGIALASGAPPSAGLWAAIVGGIIGGLAGGSYLTINGPAAGLIVVVLSAIQDLGGGDNALGFRRAIAAFCVAGLIQVGFGKLKLGRLGLAIPGSVIHGMLTAIGVIIMTKQMYVALGIPAAGKNTLEMLYNLPSKAAGLNPEVALIAASGLMLVLAFNTFQGGWKKYVPLPLLVVLSGVGLASLFDFQNMHTIASHGLTFDVSPKLLLALPSSLASTIVHPDFSMIGTGIFWVHVITVALIASIESLLSAAAVDTLDPVARKSNLDRELISKGLCNTFLGLIGGLPVIAEMVRSKANVQNGAKTQLSNIVHGAAILAFVMTAPALLNNIPLATFAAVLIPVGYALAHPSQFFHTAKVGREHFLAFVMALVVTLGTDLLIGVLAGLLVEMAYNVFHGAHPLKIFSVKAEHDENDGVLRLAFSSPLTFTNLLSMRSKIDSFDHSPHLVIDMTLSKMVDHTTHEHLHKFQQDAVVRGRKIELRFCETHVPLSNYPTAALRKSGTIPSRQGRATTDVIVSKPGGTRSGSGVSN